MGRFTSIAAYNQAMNGSDNIDKSAAQKQTEYFRHAKYIIDRYTSLSPPNAGPQEVATFITKFKENKLMIKATGVDYYSFLNSTDNNARIKLLIAAMKSGR